ncbi:DNA-directed RNA polymerases I [Sporormia fimetaria CBS 119925]|uniref:DNA-directed RNA polymerases I, II, and III subunit RPABC1 n=1 Tax=Sporormia fimetaria CBS 119925 TaxID=1340428 RepID=A0A6A6VA98_9PLEO|nr:DNA-directed RNA polymerases I [Sporormia fimetaria CBS 119925]
MEESRESYSPKMIRMWRVFRTTKEMCLDRGYQMLEEETHISLADFADKYGRPDGEPDRSRMNFSCQPSEAMIEKYQLPPTTKNPNPAPQIGTMWVEFNGDDNVGVAQLKAYVLHLTSGNYYSGMLITTKPLTTMGMRFLRGAGTQVESTLKGGIEVFVEQDLLVNITKHELVPKHVLLSREEKAQLLERYRLKETQLPRIQVTDPVAKYLGLRRGQVVKIIRKSETAGRYASYRWAI